jgi:hypothetical protein
VSAVALGLAGVLYVITSLDFAMKGSYWMALAWFAYAIANVGFIGATGGFNANT